MSSHFPLARSVSSGPHRLQGCWIIWPISPTRVLSVVGAHRLIDILMIAVCGSICGADNWVAIAEFGRAKTDWLKTFLALPNGIPSHDTFGRVFARISPWHFQDCFTAWVQSLMPKLADEGEIVPLDGKTLRRSYDTGSGQAAIHMVHAWAVKNRLVLGQFHGEEALEESRLSPNYYAC